MIEIKSQPIKSCDVMVPGSKSYTHRILIAAALADGPCTLHNVLKSEDPTEVYVAINELCYHISKDVRNALMSQYWIEWILEFDNKCRKKKERCQCIRREFAPQDDENGKDIVFLIWDAILTEAKTRPQKIITTILMNLLDLFKMRFTSGTKKRRRHLLYFSIGLLSPGPRC